MNIKKFKKLSAIVLAIIMVFSAVPTGAFGIVASAATVTSGTTGDCTWTLEGTHLTISGNGAMMNYSSDTGPWKGNITSVTIEHGVTHIGWHAFYYCTSLTSITIPDSVTSIGNYAFEYCTSLTSITIPDSVSSISDDAFYNTAYYNNDNNWSEDGVLYIGNHLIKAKEDIVNGDYTIRQGTKCIAGQAFFGCTGLTSITIPDSVTSIGWGAFVDCAGLTSITIPDSVTSIGDYAFDGCTSLTSITIPDSVTSIGDYAFYYCQRLTSITLPNSITTIGDYAFSGCTSLTSITIPNSVTSIGDFAFGWTGLTSITIPDSVTSIGGYAFYGCTRLASITILDSVAEIGTVAFYNTAYYKNDDNWTNGVLYIGNYLIKAKEDVVNADYTIRQGTKCIADNAFDWCTSLTSITIPNSVTSIGWSAFADCTGLTSITIPDSVTSIGGYAFSGCTSLTSITIPDSVTSIDWDAFEGCKIKELIIADGSKTVTETMVICNNTFEKVIIPNSVTRIDDFAFYGCKNLTSITIPDSVTSMGDVAFSGCTGLTSVTIGNSVTSIGWRAFEDCTSLTSITIPDSVTSIGDNAFYGCTGLTSVTIGNSVTSIRDYAFYGCTSLTSITIPDSVTNICEGVFYNTAYCKNDDNWTNGVLYIGNHLIDAKQDIVNGNYTIRQGTKSIVVGAFSGCTSLTSITMPDSVAIIGSSAFFGCTGLTSVTIPDSVTSIGWWAFLGCDNLVIKTPENSAAHKYALENDIDFELIVTVESNDKNITISTDSGVIPSTGVSLSTEKVENIGEKHEAQLKNLGAEKFAAYNIDLMKGEEKVQPNGKVTVSIAVPDGMDGAKCKVYRAETDGTLTDMGAVLENGKLNFTTDHFSLYIIAQFAVKLGDVNGDGVVNSGDAIEVLRHDAKAVTLTDAQLAAANVDGNDHIDSNDAILILQYDAKAIDKFPIE